MIAPPGRAERLMRWSLAPWERAAVLGDLNEEFNSLANGDGVEAARRWYWRQAIRSVWPNVIRRARGDERRLSLLQKQAFWVPYIVLSVLRRLQGEFTDWKQIVLLLVASVVVVSQALFKKRLRHNRFRKRVESVIGLLLLPLLIWLFSHPGPVSPKTMQLVTAAMVLVVVSQVWPWWGRDDVVLEEFVVRKKPAYGEAGAHLLTVTVPNRRGALSGIILCKPNGCERSSPTALHTWDPTIIRTFRRSDAVRVCVIANSSDENVVAKVELIDRSGVAVTEVRQVAPRVAIEPVLANWDDYADTDPPSALSQIDVTLPLNDVPAGSYRVRVSTPGATVSSGETDTITVVS